MFTKRDTFEKTGAAKLTVGLRGPTYGQRDERGMETGDVSDIRSGAHGYEIDLTFSQADALIKKLKAAIHNGKFDIIHDGVSK
jgi:hypothetical protein